jgi:hypothetical protein
LFDAKERSKNYPSSEFFVIEEDTQSAEKVIEWAKTLANEENDYRYNLSVIARSNQVGLKGFGFATSMLSAYKRELGTMEERKSQREANAKSEYVGVLTERLEFEAVVEKIIPTSSQWGALNIHKLRTTDGNVVTWFASGSDELETGLTYKLVGTVKKHEEYNGTKQTVVTRVKQAKRILSKEEKKLIKELKTVVTETYEVNVHQALAISALVNRLEHEQGRKV